jgi:F-type H+-transporting ATPase subunit delta
VKNVSPALVGRYARSLFQVAVERQCVENVRGDLAEIRRVLEVNPEFAAMLLNPSVTTTRVRTLGAALTAKIAANELTARFVNLLVDKDRLEILAAISPVFERLYRDHTGQIEVTVTTAVPAAEDLQQQISAHLARKSGKKPLVSWKIDPAILGGIIVHWPDRVFDGSLVRKVAELKTHMAGTV